ncbi:MAG: hypothetical protein SOR89_00745 [Ndongobacter sp.]|nr:hypothetical protein [Ndongobacter sp.]
MFKLDRRGSIDNFRSNAGLLFSACAFLFLGVRPPVLILPLAFAVSLLFGLAFFLKTDRAFIRRNTSPGSAAVSVLFVVWSAWRFYFAALGTSRIERVAETLGMGGTVAAAVLAGAGAVCALYFSLFLAAFLRSDVDEPTWKALIESKGLRVLISGLAAAGLILGAVHSFNGSIWADEAYSLRIIQYSYRDIIAMCAADVHPPLYYLGLRFVVGLGSHLSSGYYATVVIGKLFSLLPYVLLSILCWRRLRESKIHRVLALLCIFGMPQLLPYTVEIRMYGWALLFVSASFLSARDIMREPSRQRAWLSLVLFSVLSAYTHDFALVAMAMVWFSLFLWVAVWQRGEWKRLCLFGALTALLFFPWFVILLRQVGSVSESYWIEPMTLHTVHSFSWFIFAGLLCYIPWLLLIGLVGRRELSGRAIFTSGFGVLIPLMTIAVGVGASLLIRPVFIARYMVPGLASLWISAVLLTDKCRCKIQILLVSALIAGSLFSFRSFDRSERAAKAQAEKNMELVDRFEKNAVAVVSNSTHLSDTLAAYTPNMVYAWHEPASKKLNHMSYRTAFTNEEALSDLSRIREWVEAGIPVYYFEAAGTKSEDALSEDGQPWRFEPLGTYVFEVEAKVYRISMP